MPQRFPLKLKNEPQKRKKCFFFLFSLSPSWDMMLRFRWSELFNTRGCQNSQGQLLCISVKAIGKRKTSRQAQGKPCLITTKRKKKRKKNVFNYQTKCLSNKVNGSPNQQSCSLSHKVPLDCVVPCPHFGRCLKNPTHVCTESFQLDHTVCTTVSLPGACLWPLCINVKLSLNLLYTAVIILLLLLFLLIILLFSIIFGYYYGSYYVYFSVILLCHFAMCSSWSCCVFTPCYHSYYVLPYNLCCSLKKEFWKWN